LKIACIEEIAWRQGWIDVMPSRGLADAQRSTEYGAYLSELRGSDDERNQRPSPMNDLKAPDRAAARRAGLPRSARSCRAANFILGESCGRVRGAFAAYCGVKH